MIDKKHDTPLEQQETVEILDNQKDTLPENGTPDAHILEVCEPNQCEDSTTL